jgi:hypothetical protein
MAEVRIIRNLLRFWTASDSGDVVFVIVIGETGESTLLLDNACRMLLVKVVGLLLGLCVSGGDFWWWR